MIPLLAPNLLEQNPQFASLHKHLTTKLLNPDCSTVTKTKDAGLTRKKTAEAVTGSIKIRDEMNPASEEAGTLLKEEYIKRAKRETQLRTLKAAAWSGDEVTDSTMSEELQETVSIMSMILDHSVKTPLSEEDINLVKEVVETFSANLNTIATVIGKEIIREWGFLTTLLNTDTNPSEVTGPRPPQKPPSKHPRPTPRLTTKPTSPSLSALLHSHLTTHRTISTNYHSLLSTLLTTPLPHLQTLHLTHLTTQTSHLDLQTHGSHTRHLRSRLSHYATVSEGMSLKSRVLLGKAQSTLSTNEVKTAMQTYAEVLDEVERRDARNLDEVRDVLDEYQQHHGNADVEGKLKEIGKRYGRLMEEEESLLKAIEKLEMGSGSNVKRTGREGGREGGRGTEMKK